MRHLPFWVLAMANQNLEGPAPAPGAEAETLLWEGHPLRVVIPRETSCCLFGLKKS